HVLVPAGGANHNGDSGLDTADDVGDDGVRRGEVDDGIGSLQGSGGEGAAILIFLAGQRADFVMAFFGNLRHQRAGLAAAEDQDFQANPSGSSCEKNVWCRRETTSGTASSSITKLILI